MSRGNHYLVLELADRARGRKVELSKVLPGRDESFAVHKEGITYFMAVIIGGGPSGIHECD